MIRKSNLWKSTKGAVALEFALVLPIIFLLFSGIVNFGLIVAKLNALNGVVSAGMFYAFGNSSTPGNVQTAMQNAAPNLSPLTVTATQFCQCSDGSDPGCGKTCPDGSTVGSYVTVTAQSSVTLIAPDFVLSNPFITSVQGTIRTQ